MKTKNTSDRLKEIMATQGLRQIDILNKTIPFCKKYNIKFGRNDLSQYISGKVEPSQKKLTVLAEALNTNEVWLMGYDVPMDSNFGIVVDKDIGDFKKGQILRKKEEIEKYNNLLEEKIKKYNAMFDEVREYINKNLPKLKEELNQSLIKNKITIEQYNEDIKKFLWILKIVDGMTQEEFDKLVKKHLK